MSLIESIIYTLRADTTIATTLEFGTRIRPAVLTEDTFPRMAVIRDGGRGTECAIVSIAEVLFLAEFPKAKFANAEAWYDRLSALFHCRRGYDLGATGSTVFVNESVRLGDLMLDLTEDNGVWQAEVSYEFNYA